MATMPATLCVPLRRSALLSAADDERFERRTVSDREHADPLGPTELVGAERQQVDVRPERAQVDPAGGLDGVGVEQGTGRAP